MPTATLSEVAASLLSVALYRKYRPATFGEVVGQEHVTEPLCTALNAGRINHAYLFSGPRGCGKTSSARILARSLNCESGPTATPCGTCNSCVALAPGGPGNLDVTELDAASHNGVDDARELRDRAFYVPSESRYRVFIIDEAHMVTTAAFNALLKVVEEPPEHLIFIFATTEPDKVLATIRSRTHHYPFRLLAPTHMRGLLEKICAQEKVHVEDAVYPLVIRAGGGSPRDSLSVLDQLLAGAGEEGVQYHRALSLLGATDTALIDAAIDALANSDGAALFGVVESVVESGHDPRRFATDLLGRMRDLILMQAVPDAAGRGLVDAPADVLERMATDVKRIGPATLARYAELLHDGLSDIRGATAPRLLLEVICARMLLPSASDAESAVLQRLERLEKGGVARPPADSGTRAPAAETSIPQSASKQFVRASERAPEVKAPEPPKRAEPVVAPPVRLAEPPKAPEPKPVEVPKPVEATRPVEAPKPVVAQKPVEAPKPEPTKPVETPKPAAQPSGDVEVIRASWLKVRDALPPGMPKAMMGSLSPVSLEQGVLTIGGNGSQRLVDPRNAELIVAAVKKVCGIDVVIQAGGVTVAAAPRRAQPAQTSRPTSDKGRKEYVRPSRSAGPAAANIAGPDPDDPGPMEPPEEPEPDEAQDMYSSVDQPQEDRQDPMDRAISEVKKVLGGKVIEL